MNNIGALQESALLVIGGLVVEVNPTEMPSGSSPICCDFDFTVASGRTRDGLANVYAYNGSDEVLEAGAGTNVPVVPAGADWANPSNIIHDNPPNYASVSLNQVPLTPAVNNTGIVVSNWSAGDSSFTLTVTVATQINVGDVAFVILPFQTSSGGSTFGITDNKGNTWQLLGPQQAYLPSFPLNFFQVFYATMGTAVAPLANLVMTVTLTNGANVSSVPFPGFGTVTSLASGTPTQVIQNSGTTQNPTTSPLTIADDELLLCFVIDWPTNPGSLTTPSGWTDSTISSLTRSPVGWGAAYLVGTPGTYTAAWTAGGVSNGWSTTFASFTIGSSVVAAFSSLLQATGYGFSIPLTSQILGVEVQVKGLQTSEDPSAVVVMTPVGGGSSIPFQLPISQGTVTFGGPNEIPGLASLTPAQANSSSFGYEFQAFSGVPTGVTFKESACVITIFYTPPDVENFNFVGTFEQTDGTTLTIALDDTGVLWDEDIVNTPDILTPFYTAIEPDTYARGITQDDRFFMAFSDRQQGTDMPRGYNGQWLDRLSQVGPGIAPNFTATSTSYNIVSITQPAAVTNGSTGNPIRALLWSSGPGVKNQAGTVITVEYTLSTSPPDPNIYVGGGVVLSGFNTVSGNDPNGSYIVVSVQTTNTGNSTRNSFSVVNPTSFQTYDDPPMGAAYQSSLATLTLSAPAQGVQVGTQILIAGASPTDWNGTWTILNALNAAQMTITSTQLASNIATYTFSLISGTAPTAGQQVTVTNTDNGNGIFNVTNAIVQSAGANTFTVEIDAPNVAPAAEAGNAIVNGTTFTFDPGPTFVGPTPSTPLFSFIIGNDTGSGTIVQQGQLGAGPRKGVVMFLTRNGLLTAPSPYDNFTLNSGAASITASQVPLGPPNVIARVIALTGANGGFFFWLPQPVSIIDNGQTVVYSATIIPDNVTTAATFNLTDAVLLNGLSIDTQGSNNFAQIELGSSIGVTSYAARVAAWGEQDKVQNFINWSFDGGYIANNPNSPIAPAGWTVDPTNGAGGTLITSPLFGQSYYIQNTTGSTQAALGMITQTAYQDQLGTPIITVQTEYSVRVTARCPSGVTSGNLVVDLFSPSFGVAGSFLIPLASMTDTMAIFTGTLLITAFSTQVPADLLLRVWADAIPNGGDVEVDRLEVFNTASPVLTTQLRLSYFNNFEAFDGVTGNLGVGAQNQQPVRNTFSLFDNLYVVKTRSFYSTSDNGITEPYLWNVREVSNKVGTPSIYGVDVGEGWALIAGESGVYIFMGGDPVKISPELDGESGGQPGLWQSINWKYGYTLWIRNDTDKRKFYIGVPLPTPNKWMPKFPVNTNPTQPNVVLMCNYKELMTAGAIASEGPVRQTYMGDLKTMALGRKWSAWSIQAGYADFIEREDTTLPLFYCGDTGTAKIYQQESGNYADDGAAMHCFYVTYPFPKPSEAQQMHMGMHELLAQFMSMTITGIGQIRITIFPNDPNSPYAESFDPIALGNPPDWGDTELPLNNEGDRFFVGFEVRDPSEAFELSKVVMAIGQNPWAPLRGSNM